VYSENPLKKFNKSSSSPHQNIKFVFIDVLTQLQKDTYILTQNTDTRSPRYQKLKIY